ncbi:MAG: ATP-NAD kinase family protein [Candidatus Heimdallarchaeaceae archaeon]
MSLKVGFIVNPIAGLGGKKAWKGTDLISEAWSFFEKGEHYSFQRVNQALHSIPQNFPVRFYYCGGVMGEQLLSNFGFEKEMIYNPTNKRTSAEDTKRACQILLKCNVDLIIFVGGDGTARDVSSVIDDKIPVLGIPSGVKMFSGCFLNHPNDLGEILESMRNGDVIVAPEDVMDVDEEMFRENKVQASLFGHLLVPQKLGLIQGGKISSSISSIEVYKSISLELVEEHKLLKGIVVLGTGSTVYHIMKSLGREKTLLGIDVLIDGEIKFKDVDEETLYNITKSKTIKMILTPIGGQGFLLGRGNQQISSRVLSNTKEFNLIIVSTEEKLRTIDKLQIDLEEPVTFAQVKNGFIKVLVSYHQYMLKEINIQSKPPKSPS